MSHRHEWIDSYETLPPYSTYVGVVIRCRVCGNPKNGRMELLLPRWAAPTYWFVIGMGAGAFVVRWLW